VAPAPESGTEALYASVIQRLAVRVIFVLGLDAGRRLV
jgi:hypothetical protein